MPQSVLIFGTLLFLFVVYVTLKGQLPSYLAILGLKPSASTASSSASSSTQTPLGNVQGPLTVASVGLTAADVGVGLMGIDL